MNYTKNIQPHIFSAGDTAITVVLGNTISTNINEQVFRLLSAIESANISGIKELVPAYCSLTVYYDPEEIGYGLIIWYIKQLIQVVRDHSSEYVENTPQNKKVKVYKLPTLYGGDFGPDIENVANYCKLSVEEVIEIHSKPFYRVYMIGFSPGFPYLGGMDESIACPRRSSPREKVSAGSVGIAGSQTGVYSTESPGGWQIIGRTPARLFVPQANPPSLLIPGTYVHFTSITVEEYKELTSMSLEETHVLEFSEEVL